MTDWTDRLRLRQLQILTSLVGTRNLSRSAEELNTTQPALSKWLRELEEDVGLPLFERHARGLRPTPHGESLIEHARRIIAHLDSARDDMDAFRNGGHGLVVVGTSGASATETVPVAVASLLQRLPNARVRLVEGTMDILMPQLARGDIDVVVGRSAPELLSEGIRTEMLYMEPIHFVARPQHPLMNDERPDWSSLQACRWIIWPQGAPIRRALEAALAAAGQPLPTDCVESNSLVANLTLLNRSDMISVASERTARRLEQFGALRLIPMPLAGFGSADMYWRDETTSRTAVITMLESIRCSAAGYSDAPPSAQTE